MTLRDFILAQVNPSRLQTTKMQSLVETLGVRDLTRQGHAFWRTIGILESTTTTTTTTRRQEQRQEQGMMANDIVDRRIALFNATLY